MNEDLVEDVLQEAFVRGLASGRAFGGERETLNFLNRVVINTAIDFYRKRRRYERFFQGDSHELTRLQSEGQPNLETRSQDDPLDRLVLRERQGMRTSLLEQVRQVLGQLPDTQREAIELLFNRNGKSLREVCAEAGIPYSTARSRMLVGIDRIRTQLRDRETFRRLKEMYG